MQKLNGKAVWLMVVASFALGFIFYYTALQYFYDLGVGGLEFSVGLLAPPLIEWLKGHYDLTRPIFKVIDFLFWSFIAFFILIASWLRVAPRENPNSRKDETKLGV